MSNEQPFPTEDIHGPRTDPNGMTDLGDVVLRNRTEPENRAKARRAAGFVAVQLERDIAQDEALRGLLSYCETQVGADLGLAMDPQEAYADVADKLKGILDGER